MKHAARWLSVAGLALAVALFAREDLSAIVALLATAAAGLAIAGLSHVVSMTLNARAWQCVLPRATRPSLAAMTCAVWLRESVNGLVPVARIGGELVSYRLLARTRVSRAFAAGSLAVDMAVSLVSQLAFALVGVALLVVRSDDRALTIDVAIAIGVLAALAIAFIATQRRGIFERVARLASRAWLGRLSAMVPMSRRIDRAIAATYRRPRALVACFGWQLAGWIAGSIEIALALAFLGHPVSATVAVAIEAVIQAVSSVAFAVPGALGVQEGAFVVVGAMLGLDAPLSLALAAARRVRDAVVFFPGLVAWYAIERAHEQRGADVRASGPVR